LVGFDLEYFSYLSRSVSDYLSWLNTPEFSKGSTVRTPLLLLSKNEKGEIIVTCTKENTLGYVIKQLNYYRIHRIYVVDEQGRPTGIISISDILSLLLKNRNLLL
jgi:CBS-domain-containing membrane protein